MKLHPDMSGQQAARAPGSLLSFQETDWIKILKIYDWLFEMKPDPLIALNRLIVFAEVNGPTKALEEIQRMPDKDLLKNYYIYPAVLGEWNAQLGNKAEARMHFERAIELTNSPAEKVLLRLKISKVMPD